MLGYEGLLLVERQARDVHGRQVLLDRAVKEPNRLGAGPRQQAESFFRCRHDAACRLVGILSSKSEASFACRPESFPNVPNRQVPLDITARTIDLDAVRQACQCFSYLCWRQQRLAARERGQATGGGVILQEVVDYLLVCVESVAREVRVAEV